MKSSKSSSLQTFLSIVLIAVLLVFVVGFASNGFSEGQGTENNGENGEKTENSDEDKDGTGEKNEIPDDTSGDNNDNSNQPGNEAPPEDDENQTENEPEPVPTPIYINKITGLPVSESQANAVPIGVVFNPKSPLYGISSSDIAIEFPIENGGSRLLSYTTDDTSLWKIGSLVETRAFISAMSHLLGGVVISYGCDDIVSYSIWDTEPYMLDLSQKSGSYTKENYKNVFTSKEKLDYAIESTKGLKLDSYKSAPFLFTEEEIVFGVSEASSLILPFGEGNETEFYYSPKTARYLMYKSGERKVDMLSGKNVTFENVFVLFSNAVTYEMNEGSEMVIDITSGGRGYYATKGTYMEITWGLNEYGDLCFFSLDGEILTVNPGNSYVSYYKVTESESVKFN